MRGNRKSGYQKDRKRILMTATFRDPDAHNLMFGYPGYLRFGGLG